MKKSRTGSTDGDGMVRISKLRTNGLQRCLSTPASILFITFLRPACSPIKTDVDHDPRKIARDERKARVAKNEKQRSQNVARASGPREERKRDIEQTLATTRVSTASMGKFDKKLDGEKKLRGVKRKVSIHCSVQPLAFVAFRDKILTIILPIV